MDESLIWTLEDIVRFTHDPDLQIRCWAWEWLRRHHLKDAYRHMVRWLNDPFLGSVREGLTAHRLSPTPEGAEAVAAFRSRTDLSEGAKRVIDEVDHPERDATLLPLHEATDELALKPDELRRRAPSMLREKSEDPPRIALGALGLQHHRWATDIVLEHFAFLLTSSHAETLFETLYDLADPRSLPAIEAAWAPGQEDVATVCARIHHLAGTSASMPSAIAKEVEAASARAVTRKALADADPAALQRAPRRLAVACEACGRTGEYEFKCEELPDLVACDLENPRPRKRDKAIVLCKFCGSKNAYRLSLESRLLAYAGMQAD